MGDGDKKLCKTALQKKNTPSGYSPRGAGQSTLILPVLPTELWQSKLPAGLEPATKRHKNAAVRAFDVSNILRGHIAIPEKMLRSSPIAFDYGTIRHFTLITKVVFGNSDNFRGRLAQSGKIPPSGDSPKGG